MFRTNRIHVTSIISPAGITSYEYDSSSGSLSKIITPEGKEFVYHYDKGQLKEIELPNGITSSYTFDDNGNLIDLQYRKEDGPPSPGGFGGLTQRFQYTYDKNGMRTSMTDNDGTHDYAYDALYQITRATHPSVQNPVAELVEAEQFQYDEVGNWLNDNRIHNELNQLIEDDSCFYQYDLDGNMTRKIIKSTDDTTDFTWSLENKLVEVKKAGLVVQYGYDALGRRTTKNAGSNTTQFRYDGENLILEMNDNDSVIANYTFGPGIDNPLAMHRNNKNYYYLKDGLGSVTELTDSTGNAVKEYRYSVFGKIVQENGDTALWNPFTYTGREWEKELGIYFYRARYFDPEMGRFLSEDPIGLHGGDVNLLRYVNNNPNNYSDPEGLWVVQAIGAGLGATYSAIEGYEDWKSGKTSGWKYAGKIAFGAATGLAASFGGGFWGTAGRAAWTSAANETFNQSTDPCSGFNAADIGVAAATGFGVGAFSFGFGKAGLSIGLWTGNTPSISHPTRLGFYSGEIPAGTVGDIGGTWISKKIKK